MVEYRVHFVLDSTDSSNFAKNTLTDTVPDGKDIDTGYFETVSEIEGEIK